MAESLVAEFVALACGCRNGGKDDVHAPLAVECQHILCGALLVHHIVVLKKILTNTEVVLLYFLLSTFDATADHRTLNTLAVFKP